MQSLATEQDEDRRAAFERALRALRTDRRNVSLPNVIGTFMALAVLFWLPALVGAWWVPLATFVPMGLLQYRLVLTGHEAVHKTLVYPEWLNEAVGWVGQAALGVNFTSYRVQHLEHHRANDADADPDGHIYAPIVRSGPGWPRIAWWLFGTFAEVAVKVVQKGIGSVGNLERRVSADSQGRSGRNTLVVVGTQATLFLAAWASTGRITGWFEIWAAPIVLAVFVNRTRIFVEHGLPMLDGQASVGRGPATHDFVVPWYERVILSPYLFNHHASHHLHMTVPHYNLPALRTLLREARAPGYTEEVGSYTAAVRRALWHPGRGGG